MDSTGNKKMSANVERVLRTLGMVDSTEFQFSADSSPGRVSIVHGLTAEVTWSHDNGNESTSTVQFATNLNLIPVAGDWVSIRDDYIVAVSPRRTELRRPGANAGDVQAMAANIDIVLVVLPIDRELNLLMLERLAVMAFDSGAKPIVVLTKSDEADIVDSVIVEAQDAVPGVQVLTTSSQSGHGIGDLRELLHAGVTAVMLGASGAGKTSLLNALEGIDEVTLEVNRSGEGRHATTTRRLYRLSSGGVLLDIPGIRLLDLTVGQEGLDEAFADITELAAHCRFSDCSHTRDEGCAVEQAVREGVLPLRRLESWRAIRNEMVQKEESLQQDVETRKKRGRNSRPRPAPSYDDEDD
ncbi:MAG: ribosome small subunit-dependent GTPase A [Acidimicrobiales bacterium]